MDPQAALSSVSTNLLCALAIVSNAEPVKVLKRKADEEMSLSVHVPSTVSIHLDPSENVDATVESFRRNFNLQLTTGECDQVSNKSVHHPAGYLTPYANLYGVKSVRVDTVQRVLTIDANFMTKGGRDKMFCFKSQSTSVRYGPFVLHAPQKAGTRKKRVHPTAVEIHPMDSEK